MNLSTHPTLAAALGKAKVGGIVLAATVVLAGTAEAATSADLFVDDAAPVATAEPTSTPADCPTEEPVTDPSIDPTDGPAAAPTECGEPTDEPTEEPTDDRQRRTDRGSDRRPHRGTDGRRLRGREEPRGVRLRRREGHTPRARPWCSGLRGRAERLRQGQG